jgi:hypothetical protein
MAPLDQLRAESNMRAKRGMFFRALRTIRGANVKGHDCRSQLLTMKRGIGVGSGG